MEKLLPNFKICIRESVFNKDPESSELGKRIIHHSIVLIDKIGFDAFTFKKLGAEIGSNESSIYRYFENKHKLLVYLTILNWSWLEYKLVMETHSIVNPKEKLRKAIEVTTEPIKQESGNIGFDEVVLHRIIIEENSKSFLTKDVDKENREGFFRVFKGIVLRIKEMITQVNPGYKYPSSLANTIIETALHQHFVKAHFSSITDFKKEQSPTDFITDIVFKTLNLEKQ